MPPASILASPSPRRLPPRPPGRPPLLPTTNSTRPKTVRRAVSFSVELKTTQQEDTTSSEHAGHAQLQHALRQQQQHRPQDRAGAESAAAAALARRPALMRSLSLDVIDSSHIDPIEFARRRDRANSERAGGVVPQQHRGLAVVPVNEYYEDGDGDEEDDDGGESDFDGEVKKPARTDNSYSAEEIALRRFMTAVAWGPGMPVIKHNRGKGRVRRVLKFNDQEGYLCWCGTLPPYYKTRVAAETLLKATRTGNLVVVQIANQGDVGFQCSRLTDAIVLEVGLTGVIRACGQE